MGFKCVPKFSDILTTRRWGQCPLPLYLGQTYQPSESGRSDSDVWGQVIKGNGSSTSLFWITCRGNPTHEIRSLWWSCYQEGQTTWRSTVWVFWTKVPAKVPASSQHWLSHMWASKLSRWLQLLPPSAITIWGNASESHLMAPTQLPED